MSKVIDVNTQINESVIIESNIKLEAIIRLPCKWLQLHDNESEIR